MYERSELKVFQRCEKLFMFRLKRREKGNHFEYVKMAVDGWEMAGKLRNCAHVARAVRQCGCGCGPGEGGEGERFFWPGSTELGDCQHL